MTSGLADFRFHHCYDRRAGLKIFLCNGCGVFERHGLIFGIIEFGALPAEPRVEAGRRGVGDRVQDQELEPGVAADFFQRLHQRRADAAAAVLGVHHQLLDFAAMRGVGLDRQAELDCAGADVLVGGHEQATLAATDRYRLAVREFTWTPERSSLDTNALIPARTLAETAKSLGHCEVVHLALSASGAGEGLLGFEGDGRRTTSRLLDGEFPKYRALLPAEAATVATVETSALVDAVKRVALVAERNTPVRLTFSGGEVELRAGAGDEAQATEAVESSIDGDAIEIAFNPQYLLDGLSALDDATTKLSFTSSTRPAVLTGGSTEGVAAYRYLLMPVRLSG